MKSLKMADGSGAITLLKGADTMLAILITQPDGTAAGVTVSTEELRALRTALFEVQ